MSERSRSASGTAAMAYSAIAACALVLATAALPAQHADTHGRAKSAAPAQPCKAGADSELRGIIAGAAESYASTLRLPVGSPQLAPRATPKLPPCAASIAPL